MADRTVRAIFEARVAGAKKGMLGFAKDVDAAGKKVDGLTKDLKTLDAQKVKPQVEIEIDKAKKRLNELTSELADLKSQPQSLEVDFKIEQTKAAIKDVRGLLKDLTGQKAEVKIEASIKDAQKRISDVTKELGELRTMEVTPEVTADIKDAKKRLADARSSLRELNGAKAELKVTADTSQAKRELAKDMGDAGDDAGEDAGQGIAKGIIGALRTIPIAGAVVGAGVAIAGGILLGIKQGLQIEAERDLFSAKTGLDEDTSARFGRAAGEAYANAWGESVEANLDTARTALQFGLLDPKATDAEVERVIASLSGITQILGTEIPETARTAGIMLRTGVAKNADQAFDILVKGYQNGADASEDLLDTFTEYPALFAKLGLSGDEAMGLIVQGMKAGARNSDLAADALKEFQIRATDGSKTSAEGFKAIGLNAEKMTAQIAKGGEGAKSGLDTVLDRLRKMEDPVKRNAAGVALFGTKWEDLGDAMLALDVTTAVRALGSVEGSAGAAERALTTMSDNTSSKIESAQRNISVAMDGIKGALAEAFGDEISGAADWVSKNRAPLMEFFLDVIDGTFEMGRGFIGFAATALDALADVADSAAEVLVFLPGVSVSDKNRMQDAADSIRGAADTMRTDFTGALDDMQSKANDWAGPELMKARVHDASLEMAADMDAFSAAVDAAGGTVTINGDKLNAEQALEALKAKINGEDGTVTINGDKVPAEDALDTVMALISGSKGDVKVGADTSSANTKRLALLSSVARSVGSIGVTASTTAAERAIDYAARDRVARITLFTSTRVSQGLGGAHEGGFIGKGLHAGGRVPGRDPGYDNVLWPLNSGGRTLQQPLAGGEYVVNSTDAAFWGPVLELMNAGARPSASAPTGSDPAALASMVANEVRSALDGATVRMDGERVGQLVTRHQETARRDGSTSRRAR